jgi:predicted transporter
LLIIRCGFIPKALGVLVLIAGVGYLINSFTALIVPNYARHLGSITGILELGEPAIILWLLFCGAKAQSPNSQFASVAK